MANAPRFQGSSGHHSRCCHDSQFDRPYILHMTISLKSNPICDNAPYDMQSPLHDIMVKPNKLKTLVDGCFSRGLANVYKRHLVWRMYETGEFGVIHDDTSLWSAVVDHQNARRWTVIVYLVREEDMTRLLFPKRDARGFKPTLSHIPWIGKLSDPKDTRAAEDSESQDTWSSGSELHH